MNGKTNPLLVFVIEDELIIATTLATVLRNAGMDVHSFTQPLDALQVARLKAPDLLLTDVAMEQMTGIELAIRIQELSSECRILLFSGQASTGALLEDEARAGRHFEILANPFHPDFLLEKIREVMSQA